MKILSTLQEPLGKCNLKEFSKYRDYCASLVVGTFEYAITYLF